MKKTDSFRMICFLAGLFLFLSGCGVSSAPATSLQGENAATVVPSVSDPGFLQQIGDAVYADVTGLLHSDDYAVTSVSAVFVSREYLEEVRYNSLPNVFFGYSVQELDEQFAGEKYFFTPDENNQMTVRTLETMEKAQPEWLRLLNIDPNAEGLFELRVSTRIYTGGEEMPAVSFLLFAAPDDAVELSVSEGKIAAVAAAAIEGIRTKSIGKAVNAARQAYGEGFSWNAVTGITYDHAFETGETGGIPSALRSEEDAAVLYDGETGTAFLNGEKVSVDTSGAVRPDVLRQTENGVEAIEVKNYDLSSEKIVDLLCDELERQVEERKNNLPEGSTQRLVLDVRGRSYPEEMVTKAVNDIHIRIGKFYVDLPVDIIW